MRGLIYGQGVMDLPLSKNPNSDDYILQLVWRNMLKRCYSESYLSSRPSYRGCSVDPLWLKYSGFRSWAIEQDFRGKSLDKDIIVPGNTVYGPKTCVFVSQFINSVILLPLKKGRDLPPNVYRCSKTNLFHAQMRGENGRLENLGRYKTPDEAFAVYCRNKSERIKKVATLQSDPVKQGLLKWASIIADGKYTNYIR